MAKKLEQVIERHQCIGNIDEVKVVLDPPKGRICTKWGIPHTCTSDRTHVWLDEQISNFIPKHEWPNSISENL